MHTSSCDSQSTITTKSFLDVCGLYSFPSILRANNQGSKHYSLTQVSRSQMSPSLQLPLLLEGY